MRVPWPVLLVLAALLAGLWLWSRRDWVPAPEQPTTPGAEPRAASSAPEPVGTDTVAHDPDGAADASEPVASVPREPWIVRGHVLEAHAAPLPGARVRLECFAGPAASGAPIAETTLTTGPDGAFAWALQAPTGTVTLRGRGATAGYTNLPTTRRVVRGGDAPQDLVIWAVPFDRVAHGTVTDERGEPIAGAWIASAFAERRVADDGTFRLELASAYVPTVLTAGAPGFTTARETLAVPDAQDPVVHFRLRPGYRIEGRVLDEEGAPIEGAAVATLQTLDAPVASDANGRFEISHADRALPEHLLIARKAGFLEATTTVDATVPAVPHELVLRRGVRVHGRVLTADGAPIAAADLYIGSSPNAYNRLDAVSADDGAFEFAAVPRGEQTLVASHADFAPDRRVLELPPDATEFAVEIRLGPAHFLAGVVVDDTVAPVVGAAIGALVPRPGRSAESVGARVRSTDDGSFRLDGLPAGRVDLEVSGTAVARTHEPDVAVDRTDVRIVAPRAARFAGTVVDATTGAPVADFRVRFVAPELAPGDQAVRGHSATWGREGTRFQHPGGVFRTDDEAFARGAVTGLEISAAGYAPARVVRAVAAVDPDPAALIVPLWPGATLLGRVVRQSDGSPLAGAQVVHFDGERPLRGEPAGQLRATTSHDGAFTLRDVPIGDAFVAVVAAGLPSYQAGPFAMQSGETSEILVQVPAGARLRGLVLDADGQPLAGARIDFDADGSDWSATSDASGRFAFAQALPPGTFVVGAAASRNGTAFALCELVQLVAGEQHEVTLRPRGQGVLRGTITGDAANVEEVELFVWPRGEQKRLPGPFRAICSGASFELRGLPAGRYDVLARSGRHRSDPIACRVDAARPTVIEVRITADVEPGGGR